MNRPKVCILIPDFPICTGANTQALHLALCFKKMGLETFMVFSLNTSRFIPKPCYDKAFAEQLYKADITIYKKPENMISKWACYKFYFKLFWKLRNEYQIVFLNGMSSMACWFIPFFKLLGKKTVMRMTGMGINDPGALERNANYNWLSLKMLSLADRFIGTSTTICETYKQNKRLPNKKLVQIHNGVDTDIFYPLPDQTRKQALKEKLGLPPEDKLVTYVGTVRRTKGLDILLTSWETVTKQYPNATLLIIGPLCPLCPAIRLKDKDFIKLLKEKAGLFIFEEKTAIRLLHLTKPKLKVKVLGTKININEYLQATDIFAFLSQSEGMPNALMEAMAAGLPCITSDIGEICGDLITHEKVGQSVRGNDPQGLADKILNLLQDEKKRTAMGKAARRKILDEFTIEKTAQKHHTLYNKLLTR